MYLAKKNLGAAEDDWIDFLKKKNHIVAFSYHHSSKNDSHPFIRKIMDAKTEKINLDVFLKQAMNIYL